MKRLSIILVAFVVVLSSCKNGMCGEELEWMFIINTGTLEISGTGAMDDYDDYRNPAPWHPFSSKINEVILKDGITRIGSAAFYECPTLTSVSIPNSVKEIGDYAFTRCTNLSSVIIPNSVNKIERNAFAFCYELTSVTIPDSVEEIDACVFTGCTGLTSLTIPHCVTRIGDSAFKGCSNLKSLFIPASVTEIGDRAFSYCKNLSLLVPKSAKYNDGHTSDGSYYYLDHSFQNCASVTFY